MKNDKHNRALQFFVAATPRLVINIEIKQNTFLPAAWRLKKYGLV